MAKKKALFMTALLVVAFGLTALVAVLAEKKEESTDMLCVTSFYPVYLLADAVAEGAEGVTVRNLTENHGGCIHDYTLTTQDMRLLTEAELFLINGGEMELFMSGVAENYKDLTVIDTSEGYDFLEGVEHSHDHGHEANGHEEAQEQHAEDEHDHSHAINGHVWLDIDGYLMQLSKVEEAFVAADPAQEALYRKNAEACRNELSALAAEFEQAKTVLKGKEAVVFHEGFVYLLNMLGVETIHCLAMDSDTQISAGEAAEIIEECKLHGITQLFVEADYAKTVTDTFAGEIGGKVVVLNPVTEAESAAPDADGRDEDMTSQEEMTFSGISLYCNLMRENLAKIKQAYGLQ